MTQTSRRKRTISRPDLEVRQKDRYIVVAADSPIDAVIRRIRAGLPFKTLESFSAGSGIAVGELAALIDLPERTLARRKLDGKLTSGESEKLLRVASIFEKTVELFEGSVGAAVAWLKAPNRALGGESPWIYLETEIGAREVEDLIGRLEQGVFA